MTRSITDEVESVHSFSPECDCLLSLLHASRSDCGLAKELSEPASFVGTWNVCETWPQIPPNFGGIETSCLDRSSRTARADRMGSVSSDHACFKGQDA